jgi:hypothetical protein
VKVGSAADVVDQYLGDVHRDRTAGGGEGVRWGSGEGRMTKFELLDAHERPVTTVHTGETVIFRFHYEMSKPIEQPVFGMAIHTINGVQVTGPNTKEADATPAVLSGRGHIDLKVDRLLLTRGIYDVTTSLFDHACLHAYDFNYRGFRFDVERGDPGEEIGPISLGGRWEIPAVKATK